MRHHYYFLLFLLLTSMFGNAQVYADTRLNGVKMRSCDDLNCQVIRELGKGVQVEIIGLGRYFELGGYGNNAWLRVRAAGTEGFIYGAMLSLKIPLKNLVRDAAGTAYAWQGSINVRQCPGLDCAVLFQMKAGEYFKVIGRSTHKTLVAEFGEDYWLAVDYRQRTGYLFGGLAQYVPKILVISENQAPVYSKPNGQKLGYVAAGNEYPIRSQSIQSELRRPWGRNYWYELIPSRGDPFWVYGGYTDQQNTPVDCQCVDYLKNRLEITGPTNNATDWGAVLRGEIVVTLRGSSQRLSYQQVTEPVVGDIAIFRADHGEVHPAFGHIGVVASFLTAAGVNYVEVIGANHPLDPAEWYADYNCLNVSKHRYIRNRAIEFYRQNY